MSEFHPYWNHQIANRQIGPLSGLCAYLEERYPTPSLLPPDPAARAILRIEELECVDYLSTAFRALARQLFFMPPERRDAAAIESARADVARELERFEERAARRRDDFVLGATLTRADCAWLPSVELTGRAGVNLDSTRTPWLVAWRERMRGRPSYDRSYLPHWRT